MPRQLWIWIWIWIWIWTWTLTPPALVGGPWRPSTCRAPRGLAGATPSTALGAGWVRQARPGCQRRGPRGRGRAVWAGACSPLLPAEGPCLTGCGARPSRCSTRQAPPPATTQAAPSSSVPGTRWATDPDPQVMDPDPDPLGAGRGCLCCMRPLQQRPGRHPSSPPLLAPAPPRACRPRAGYCRRHQAAAPRCPRMLRPPGAPGAAVWREGGPPPPSRNVGPGGDLRTRRSPVQACPLPPACPSSSSSSPGSRWRWRVGLPTCRLRCGAASGGGGSGSCRRASSPRLRRHHRLVARYCQVARCPSWCPCLAPCMSAWCSHCSHTTA